LIQDALCVGDSMKTPATCCSNANMGVRSELHMENIRLELATLHSPKEVFYCIWDKSEELQLRIIITLWALSMERNNVNAGERHNSPAQIGSQIQRHCFEFTDFFSRHKRAQSTTNSR
jgi:hypothetical protein